MSSVGRGGSLPGTAVASGPGLFGIAIFLWVTRLLLVALVTWRRRNDARRGRGTAKDHSPVRSGPYPLQGAREARQAFEDGAVNRAPLGEGQRRFDPVIGEPGPGPGPGRDPECPPHPLVAADWATGAAALPGRRNPYRRATA